MMRFLDELDFIFRRGTPKQKLIMRELRKEALTVYFAKKHCFPKKTKHGRVRVMPVGKGYSAIQAYLWNCQTSARKVLYRLASS